MAWILQVPNRGVSLTRELRGALFVPYLTNPNTTEHRSTLYRQRPRRVSLQPEGQSQRDTCRHQKPIIARHVSTSEANHNMTRVNIGRDPKSYNNPEEFEPEMILSSDIDYKGNDFEVILFGAGRRGCPGIQFDVAVKEIALANLVHKFDWPLPGGARGEDLDMTESTGATVHRKYPLKAVAILYSC
ncbi:hypothetical protein ACFX13_045152 [Malus domestica]